MEEKLIDLVTSIIYNLFRKAGYHLFTVETDVDLRLLRLVPGKTVFYKQAQ